MISGLGRYQERFMPDPGIVLAVLLRMHGLYRISHYLAQAPVHANARGEVEMARGP
jgi:hypothetical protein